MQSSPTHNTLEKEAKKIIEALLFSSSEPLSLSTFVRVLKDHHPFDKSALRKLLGEIAGECIDHDRPYRLEELAGGYILRTCPRFHPFISSLSKSSRQEKLSQAAMEVLAIIAFRQPITRVQIEEIRGVDSSSIITLLIEKGLIEIAGKLEAPGRPLLFKTSTEFLNYFGLFEIKDLQKYLKIKIG